MKRIAQIARNLPGFRVYDSIKFHFVAIIHDQNSLLSVVSVFIRVLYLHLHLKKHVTSSPFRAALLLTFLLAAWLGKATHVFFGHGHHHHEEKLVCAHEANDNAAHIHDERYATADCELCAFVLSGPDQLPQLVWPEWQIATLVYNELVPLWETPLCAAVFSEDSPTRAP